MDSKRDIKSKKYMEIYEDVRRDIIKGVYPTGRKIPSKRVMAESMGVSLITVEHAYELLAEEGYILSKEKQGYYVIFDENNSFGTNKDDLVVSKVKNTNVYEDQVEQSFYTETISYNTFAKTTRHVLSEYNEELLLKSPGSGTVIFRQAIANYLFRSRNINVAYDQIIIGSGAEYLYGLIVQAWGRNVIYGIENPSYQKISDIYNAGGVKLEKLSLGQDGIDSNFLWNSRAKVLHISPYRSYPSKITSSASKKREYLRWCKEKDAIIIEDDVESEFTPSRKPEETLFSLDDDERVIYINTFTKTVGPFIRTAYMVIPRSMKPFLRERIGFYSCPVPTLDQYIIAELLNNGDFERHINRVRRNNRKNNK